MKAAFPDVDAPPTILPPRIPTYVIGFDEALGGGIPAGSIVIIAGAAGTMKSSLAISIVLNHAAKVGARALYTTMEEGVGSLLRQAVGLGLDTTSVPHHVRILDLAYTMPEGSGDWLPRFQSIVEDVKKEEGCDLLVIDSLEGFAVHANLEDRRRGLFQFFEWLRSLEMTTLVTAERPDLFVQNAVVAGRWDEDFLADGVIHLRLHVTAETEVQRRIRCVKMRGAAHDPSYLALFLDGGNFVATKSIRTG